MPRQNNGPRLCVNKRGIYEIRWTDNGRSHRRSTRADNFTEAQRALFEFLTNKPDKHGPLTVGNLLNAYCREHVDRQCVDTARQYNICAWLRSGFGPNTPVVDIDANTAHQYQSNRRRDNGVSDSTLRRELTTLIAAINHAVRTKRIERSHVPYIPLPADSAPRDFYLSKNETAILLDVARGQSELQSRLTRADRFLCIALATAARKTAILNLGWKHVDFKNGMIRFDRMDYGTQTKKRRVAVPIADWLLPTLVRAFDERVSEYVLDHSGDIRRCLETVTRQASHDASDSRFKQVTPHTLRHTAATQMAQAGVELFFIAGVLGDTMATVSRVYAKHAPDYLRGAVNATAVQSIQQD